VECNSFCYENNV